MPLFIDTLIQQFDTVLRTVMPPQQRGSERLSPAKGIQESELSADEKRHVAGLMRVNHSGEVCAQALYQGQALTAKLPDVRDKMNKAAEEEVDHLAWCEERLQELQSRPSLLNLFWYTQSFLIGALAGLAGDKYSLGFVAETEHQVSAHLQDHLSRLPEKDHKTKAILEQMDEDERHHADIAIQAGGTTLPQPVRKLMGMISKAMTYSSYYI